MFKTIKAIWCWRFHKDHRKEEQDGKVIEYVCSNCGCKFYTHEDSKHVYIKRH